MAVLGHAASAEDGSGFGRPGDQTGREVRMDTLGADGNAWVYIYRYPDESKAYNIAEAARQACMNDYVGYSRETYTGWGLYYTRYGLWEAAHETGDIRQIKTLVNCDCSAMVSTCIWIAGIPGAVREMVTAVEDSVLTAAGFTRLPYKLESTRKGDILLRSGHTGVVVEGWEGNTPEPTPKYVGRITRLTRVFKTPKVSADNILLEHPLLGKDNLVDVCDETEGFYYVRIIDVYGYVPQDALVKNDERPKPGDKVHFNGGYIYISANGGGGIEVPAFDGTLRSVLDGNFRYPCDVHSKRYEGWCKFEDLTKI